MKPFTALMILLATMLGWQCTNCVTGEGPVQQEERIVPEFSSIKLDCSARVILRDRLMNEKNKVVIHAQANLLPQITAKVSLTTLEIDISGCTKSSEEILVYVYVNEISKVSNDGSGSIQGENMMRADQFEINHNSSGNIELNVKANKIDVNHDGSGNLKLEGNTDKLSISHDGSGQTDAIGCHADEGKVNLDGSGTVSVYATRELDLKLNGSGNIIYSGKPETLNTRDDGSGEIREAE